VCIYIQNHHATMAFYCQYSLMISLKVPLEIRFVCNFLMIACMLQVKNALERMVIDPRWNEYVSTLFNQQNGHYAYALVGAVRATIHDDGFWQQCNNFQHIVQLVLKAL
jgi:hypothetical protein